MCALSLPSAIMLWAEGSRRSAYKILLIKMRSILLSDLPSSTEMPSIRASSSGSSSTSQVEWFLKSNSSQFIFRYHSIWDCN